MKIILTAIKELDNKDKLVVSFSIIAILLSSINTYYQHFYKKKYLSASIISYECHEKNVYTLKTVFCNSGTEPIAITSSQALLVGAQHKENKFGDKQLETNFEPFVINPGIVLIKNISFKFTDSDIEELYNTNKMPRFINLRFSIIDSSGKVKIATKKVFKLDKSGATSSGIYILLDGRVMDLLQDSIFKKNYEEWWISKVFCTSPI